MDLQWGQVFTQIVAFLLMLWVLRRFAWNPILQHLEDRREKIAAEFKMAETKNLEARFLHELYEEKIKAIDIESRSKIQDAIREGQKVAYDIHQTARKEAKAILVKAQEDAASELSASKIQLRNDVVTMALTAAQKVLDTTLEDKQSQEKMVQDFIIEADFK